MVNKKIEILIFHPMLPFTSNLFDFSSPKIRKREEKNQKKSKNKKHFIAKEINSISFVFSHVMYGICFVLIDLIDYAFVVDVFFCMLAGKLKNMFKGK